MNLINTRNGELLNAGQIINFNIAKGEAADEKTKITFTMYAVIAVDILGKTHDLGFYETEDQAATALEELTAFFELDKMSVFEMPDYENSEGK